MSQARVHESAELTSVAREFDQLPSPAGRVLVLGGLFASCFGIAYFASLTAGLPARFGLGTGSSDYADDQEWLVFLAYLALFGGMWLCYFLSHPNHRWSWFHVRSLRRLLTRYAETWFEQNTPETGDTGGRTMFHDKATAGLQVLAILIAVSMLELDVANAIYQQFEAQAATPGQGASFFQQVTLGSSVVCALASFVCFVISVDALDTIFNKFKSPDDANTISGMFYRLTINPKYVGLVLLLLGAIFLVCVHSRVIASMALGLVIVVGYPYWFPKFKKRSWLWYLWYLLIVMPLVIDFLVVGPPK